MPIAPAKKPAVVPHSLANRLMTRGLVKRSATKGKRKAVTIATPPSRGVGRVCNFREESA